MTWTLCTSGAAVAKAGNHCNAISGSVVTMAKWSDEAEGSLCVLTNTDWITNYSTLKTPIKNALSDVCSSMIGSALIIYDSTGYLSREADMLMNRNDEIIRNGLKFLDGKANTLKTP